MKKMSTEDVKLIVQMLRAWRQGPLTWERVRAQTSALILGGERAWSRQSLQAHEAIQIAWLAAKERLAAKHLSRPMFQTSSAAVLEKLRGELKELQVKYDNLARRHRQLVYNASLLPGGTRLFVDPLPDNTPVQSAYRGGRKRDRA